MKKDKIIITNITTKIIRMSFCDDHNEEEHCHHHEEADFLFTKCIILNHEGTLIAFWKPFHVFCSLASSYLYGYLACFDDSNEGKEIVIPIFETIFTLSMIFEFITDFKENVIGSHTI